jgi:signal transduction histidine kinase
MSEIAKSMKLLNPPKHRLKTRILAPLFTLLVAFVIPIVIGGLVIDRYDLIRHQAQRCRDLMRRTSEISRHVADANEALLQYGLTHDAHFLEELTRAEDELDADLIVVRSLASSVRPETEWYVKTYAEELEASRRLKERLLAAENGPSENIQAVFKDWQRSAHSGRARLRDLLNHFTLSIEQSEESMETFLLAMAAGFGLTLLLGAIAVSLVARYFDTTVLNPLRAMHFAFRRVGDGDLSTRVPEPAVRDELWEMATEFNAMTIALAESQDDIKAFVSVAAHDLRSPLATISGFAEIAEDDLNAMNVDEARGAIGRVRAISARAVDLIDQLLKFEQAGTIPLAFSRVRLGDLVEEATENLASQIRESGAYIDIDALPEVEGDASLLRALFQNLLGNAIKYARPDVPPYVRVVCDRVRDRDGEWIKVRVIDNGRGFQNDQVGELFKAFSRLKTVRKIDGFGVGLSTCRKIVLRHRGMISAEGRPGEGATFTVRLPALPVLEEEPVPVAVQTVLEQKKYALPGFPEGGEARIFGMGLP